MKGRFPAQAGDTDQIVFRALAGRVDAPAVRSVVVPLLQGVSRVPHVTSVVSPYDSGARAVSRDGTIGFATFACDKRANEVSKAAVNRLIHTAEAVRSPALQVELGGQAIQQ